MATDLGKVGMVDKGNYNSASTYETMDVVTYNSSTYIAIQAVPANTAPTNTSYWREAFGNAIIGTSSISNVAASITEAIGNTALPSGIGSISAGISLFGSQLIKSAIVAQGTPLSLIFDSPGMYIVFNGDFGADSVWLARNDAYSTRVTALTEATQYISTEIDTFDNKPQIKFKYTPNSGNTMIFYAKIC